MLSLQGFRRLDILWCGRKDSVAGGLTAASGSREAAPGPVGDRHQREHHRHFDQHAHHGGQRRSAAQPEQADRHGHGHVGMCAGATTGREVANLVAGRAPEVDLVPFSAARFG